MASPPGTRIHMGDTHTMIVSAAGNSYGHNSLGQVTKGGSNTSMPGVLPTRQLETGQAGKIYAMDNVGHWYWHQNDTTWVNAPNPPTDM